MRKAKYILIVGLFLWLTNAYCQDGTYFSQFYNGVARNQPALSGVDPYLDLNLGYKQPWKGFGDNASAFYLSAFGQIKKGAQLDEGYRSFRISDPTIYDELKQTNKVRRKHGVGLTLSSERMGAFKNFESKLFYAYHIPVTNSFNLSLGSGFGIYQQQIDYSDLTVRDMINDDFYNQLIAQGQDTYSRFLMDFGLAFYSEQIYFTVTGKSLVDESMGGDEFVLNLTKNVELDFLAGGKIKLGINFELHPNLGLKYNDIFGLRYMGSLRLKYKELIFMGGSLDDDFKYSFLFGVKAMNGIYVHYSYDFHSGYVNEFTQGSHEFTLAFRFLNKYGTSLVSW